MPNQFHRRLTEAELHRPDRTGFGDPNLKTFVGTKKSSFTLPPGAATKISVDDLIFNPEDGQMYQDLNNGDLYRYIKFGRVPLEAEQGTFIGKLGTSKASGTESEALSIVESEAATDNGLTVAKGQKISIQTQNGDIQVLRASETQTFISPRFTLKVNPFFYEFDAGEAFENPTDVVSFNSDGVWEKLIEFDKETGRITNVLIKETSDAIGMVREQFGGERKVVQEIEGATFWIDRGSGLTFDTFAELEAYLISVNSPRSEWSGRITSRVIPPTQDITFIAREVAEIKADLYAQITEGEEITVYNPVTGDAVKLTVNDNGDDEITSYGPAENITIDVQDDRIRPIFPVGSLIYGEEGYRESSMKVDPSRIQLNVLNERVGDGIGALVNDIGVVTDKTTISLKNIDEITSIPDEQVLIILNKRGDVKKIVADGAQQLTVGTDTLTVQPFSIAQGDPVFEADTSVVKEPSYSSTGRITITENSISQAVSDINETSASVASLTLTVDANSASISSQASLISANSSSITSIDQRVTSAEASITSQASLISSNSSSISTIDQRVTANEANITQSVQFDDSGASIILLAGPGGSQISISADTISLNDIDVIQNDGSGYGVIKSNNFSTGTTGWRIKGDGSAEFNGVVNFNSTQGTFTQNLFVESDGTSSRLGMFYQNNETFRLYNVADRTSIDSIGTYVQSGTTYNKYISIDASENVGSGDSTRILVLPDDTVFKTVSGAVASVDIHPRLALNASNTSFGTSFTGKLFVGGDIRWNATTSTSATAGSNGAVPSQVAGYVVLNISGTNYKLPYFNT